MAGEVDQNKIFPVIFNHKFTQQTLFSVTNLFQADGYEVFVAS
ncbi:MAG: hypothetical protein KatS3mg084_0583 [Candidatus Dojkabacteria bacterium]|nr:MAG: hypothetical protein KatS3mg084_0583 [Candidatus Dojkabacteria bacterium]